MRAFHSYSALPAIDHRLETRAAAARRVRTIARWMDNRMLDPLLGLVVPGVGDLASSAFGLITVGLAIRHRLHPVVIARMLLNLGLDAAIGSIPIVGDLFDVVHQAHKKNAALFSARHQRRRATWRDWTVVGLAFVAFLLALALPIFLLIKLFSAL